MWEFHEGREKDVGIALNFFVSNLIKCNNHDFFGLEAEEVGLVF